MIMIDSIYSFFTEISWLNTILIGFGTLLVIGHIESPLQYTIKMALFYLVCIVLATVSFPIGVFRPFNPTNHRYVRLTFKS